MSAGTLTLTNNSAAVTGSGTAFNNELAAGDFIVVKAGGVTYTLPVKTIESDTALTLARNYNGPAVTAGAWTAMPRDTLNRISAQIAADTAYAIRQRVLEIDNWYQLLEVNGNVTIKMADGSSFSGPSWKKIADLLEAIDESTLQALATQVHNDAQQVATDKAAAASAASTATQAKTDSQTAQSASEVAASGAASSNQSAAQHASDAGGSATAAANSAASIHPENLLQKANHLSEFAADTDAAAARGNLKVFSKSEIADLLPGYLGQIDWQEMRTALEPGTVPRDGQEVPQTGLYADLYAKAVAGKLPTCTEAEWQSNPLNRGCYVLTSSPGKMRLPDDNGVQPGSLKIPVHVGDGGSAANNGKMGASALPNVKASFGANTTTGPSVIPLSPEGTTYDTDGMFSFERGQCNRISGASTTGGATFPTRLVLDASSDSKIYQDGVTEVRSNRMQGCWTVRIAAKATNGGSIDALALATEIASGDAALEAKIVATNARIDFAMLDAGTMAINTGKLLDNPFGNSTPVSCEFQAYHPVLLKWISVEWMSVSTTNIYGGRAFYSEGEGIIIRAGQQRIFDTNQVAGLLPDPTTVIASVTSACPVRVLITKVIA